MQQVIELFEKLTGQTVPLTENVERIQAHQAFSGGGISWSQFNELLLMLGFDRVTEDFFKFLYESIRVTSFDQLEQGIDEFRKKAMLLYGNIKFGFKKLSQLKKIDIDKEEESLQYKEITLYKDRQPPVITINKIEPENTYYLSNLPFSGEGEKTVGEEIKRIGKENLEAYLSYDYMDVYIATSMRERYEFWTVANFVNELFEEEQIKELNLRWFDPTQAYCEDRVDKGLVEAMILKRADCTIYHAQESETFGKDSELAITLAQGKPVIVYVPQLKNVDEFIAKSQEVSKKLYPGENIEDVFLKLLPHLYPKGPWENAQVRMWLDNPKDLNLVEACHLVFEEIKKMYDKRASTLKEYHPLGLQVNLRNGVANGVLVVRTIKECATLLRRIILNRLEFDIEEPPIPGEGATLLKERTTKSIYRVITENKFLTNSFWNFYLK